MIASRVKGWCPGALRPMESGDGLIVRLKLTGGIVPLGLAAKIADWSRRWGNGQIDLTQRANLQLRGLTEATVPALQEAMAAERLLDADPDGEAVRNVIASPLAGIDPTALLDIRQIVGALEARLAGDRALHALPAKFCFAVDDGGRFGLGEVRADIRFEAIRTEIGVAFAVGFDGAPERFGPVAAERLVDTAATLAKAVIATGARRMRELGDISRLATSASLNASPRRQSRLLRSAAATFGREGETGKASALAGGGYGAASRLLGLWPLNPTPAATDVASTSPSRGEAKTLCVGVGLPFGRIAGDDLAALAKSAVESGATEIRLTPWRAILIPCLASAVESVIETARTIGLILDPADPRHRAAACVGAPACASATTDVRAAAERLAPLVGESGFLHVSGCAKGCAHPRSASVTLVGRDGLYDLVRTGRPGASPSAIGLTLDAAARHLRDMAAATPRSGIA